jgi:hypothetical protein
LRFVFYKNTGYLLVRAGIFLFYYPVIRFVLDWLIQDLN